MTRRRRRRRQRQPEEGKRLRTATISSTSSMVAVATMVTLSLSASCELSYAFSVGSTTGRRGRDIQPQRLEACLHATSTTCDHTGVLPPTAAYASSVSTHAFHTTRHKGGVAWDAPRYGGRSSSSGSSSTGFQRGSSSPIWRPHHDDALLGFQLFSTQESDAVSEWQYSHPAQQHQMVHPLKNAALWMPYSNQSPSTTTPTHVAPAWLPWIPTRTQIESLRVVELKGACAERTLAKVRYYTLTRIESNQDTLA